MKIISWNVNGLRAVHRKESIQPILKKGFDILCLQETKSSPDQLPSELQNPEDYHTNFSSSELKKGYSGVAIYSKEKPTKVENKIGVGELDKEGRTLIIHFKDFVLINGYFPMTGREDRLQQKMDYNDAILKKIIKLKKTGKSVVLCGDLNVAHEEIDLARPKENDGKAGFRPEERAWADELVSAGFIDVFRHFYPNKKEVYTFWDMKTRARDRNVGWRIDYFFVSNNLIKKLKSFKTLSNVYGSDHCPVLIEFK
jgi:exodeoxyribonuclease III